MTAQQTQPSPVDDQFRALMEGLRTTMPGVQVLLAFLLTIPLQSGFADLDRVEEVAYIVALVSAAAASVLLIAPSAHQRIRSIERDGEVRRRTPQHLLVAVRITLAGTVLASVAIVSALFLASSVVLDRWMAVLLAAIIGGLAAWTWFWIPVVEFDNGDRRADS